MAAPPLFFRPTSISSTTPATFGLPSTHRPRPPPILALGSVAPHATTSLSSSSADHAHVDHPASTSTTTDCPWPSSALVTARGVDPKAQSTSTITLYPGGGGAVNGALDAAPSSASPTVTAFPSSAYGSALNSAASSTFDLPPGFTSTGLPARFADPFSASDMPHHVDPGFEDGSQPSNALVVGTRTAPAAVHEPEVYPVATTGSEPSYQAQVTAFHVPAPLESVVIPQPPGRRPLAAPRLSPVASSASESGSGATDPDPSPQADTKDVAAPGYLPLRHYREHPHYRRANSNEAGLIDQPVTFHDASGNIRVLPPAAYGVREPVEGPYPSITVPSLAPHIAGLRPSANPALEAHAHVAQLRGSERARGLVLAESREQSAAGPRRKYGRPSGEPLSRVVDVERPFLCDVCPQSFTRNHDLKRHKRIHLTVKPYPCGWCEKTFSRKDALKRHLLVKGCAGMGPVTVEESVAKALTDRAALSLHEHPKPGTSILPGYGQVEGDRRSIGETGSDDSSVSGRNLVAFENNLMATYTNDPLTMATHPASSPQPMLPGRNASFSSARPPFDGRYHPYSYPGPPAMAAYDHPQQYRYAPRLAHSASDPNLAASQHPPQQPGQEGFVYPPAQQHFPTLTAPTMPRLYVDEAHGSPTIPVPTRPMYGSVFVPHPTAGRPETEQP